MKRTDKTATYRILDANANRLREGLRTVEEYFRFVGNDRKLTRSLKELRHQAADALAHVDSKALLAARNSDGDVGKAPDALESSRKDLLSVACAGLKRCQEAARVLEEYTKLLDDETANRFKKIRFRLYNFEKRFILGR